MSTCRNLSAHQHAFLAKPDLRNLLLVDILQLLLVPLQLFLQHLHLPRQVLARRPVTLALLGTLLQLPESRLVTLRLVFRGLEAVLKGGNELLFLQEVLLELSEGFQRRLKD